MKEEISIDLVQVLIGYVRDPIVILDEQGKVRYASDSFLTLEMELGAPLVKAWVLRDGEKKNMQTDVQSFLYDPIDKTNSIQDIPILWGGRSFVISGTHDYFSKKDSRWTILKLVEVGHEEPVQSNQLEVAIRSHKEELQVLEEAVRHRTQELETANEELRQANRDLTSFTNITNHDLQEPLRKIRNFINRIQEDPDTRYSELSRYHFKRIQVSVKRMQRLLDDVLRYARIRDKERLFKKSDLSALVKEVLQDFRKVIDEKKATMDVQALGVIEVVPDQFKELIRQLLSNSLKFHKPDQCPRLSIKSRYILPESALLKEVSVKQHYLDLIIEDQGIGIEEEYREKIFEVFQQLHPAGTYEGTGIGLPICKRIVENHKGFIQASGKKDQGMRVDVYLPVRQEVALKQQAP